MTRAQLLAIVSQAWIDGFEWGLKPIDHDALKKSDNDPIRVAQKASNRYSMQIVSRNLDKLEKP